MTDVKSFKETRLKSQGYRDGMRDATMAIARATVENTRLTKEDILADREWTRDINRAIKTLVVGVRFDERAKVRDEIEKLHADS